jgi:uncharacterized protein (DUF1778 family)
MLCFFFKIFAMTRKKLFEPVKDEDRKDSAILVRVTKNDAEAIRYEARIRQLSTCEFMRRAALGRKTDVEFETEIVLELSGITRAVRRLHAAIVETGVAPAEEEWRPLFDQAIAAMKRIGK